MVAPWILLILGCRYKIDRVFAFGHTYAFFMQPLRLIKGMPVTVFLRADTIKNHVYKQVPNPVIILETLIEGAGLHGCKTYTVSKALTENISSRHCFFKPVLIETLTNDIKKKPEPAILTSPYALPLKLACAGILEKRKNQDMLLKMMVWLPPDQACLFLFGIGPDESRLKEQVDKIGLEDRVIFKGWVKPDDIWSNIDLLLVPSLHEGCPNSVLEAMENNIPVLASKIPEHEEILPPSQLIGNDPFLWCQTIQKILHDPDDELKKMRVAQHPFALSLYFNWDNEVSKRILQ
jgi:glycosyltransferase involved in cell wall biosynthesis